MSWMARRPQASDSVAFYTVGLNETVLLVGLGNPGPEYEMTRHNVGFMCLDEFVAKTDEMSDWVAKKDLKCLLSTGQMAGKRVIAIKPSTFMNLSGEAVQATLHFYKVDSGKVLVVHDELDIDFGQIRLRTGGSSAGHKGVESVSQCIGEGYGRIRVGVGPKTPPEIKSESFVLKPFPSEQVQQLGNLKRETLAILSEYLFSGQLPHETRSFLV